MKSPVLDDRSLKELMDTIEKRSAAYVPEWRYEAGSDDPGAALSTLFGELFYQTIDRYNLIPAKFYTEFLNLMGVSAPAPTPASGYVYFEASSAAAEPVPVAEGTELYAVDEDGANIIYSTERKIEASSAVLADVYYTDSAAGVIEKLDMSRDQPFFAPAGGENLQKHCFRVYQNRALAVSGPAVVELQIKRSSSFLEEGTASRLADPEFASWSYFDGSEQRPFDAVSASGGRVVLQKLGDGPIAPDAQGRIGLSCEMSGAASGGSIIIDGILVKSEMTAHPRADAMFSGDVELPFGDGGYCFGRRPAPYALFYVRCDDIFIKRGAQVSMELDIVPITQSSVGSTPQYSFDKRIIDKKDAVAVVPDDVFVEQVVWEYYNGYGWARLSVDGDRNPFSCKREGELRTVFTVPADMESTVVNAEEGCFVRARVVNVENYLSQTPRWIVPFIRDLRCAYSYPGGVPAELVTAENNGKYTEIADTGRYSQLEFTAFSTMEPNPRAMYLRFEGSPHAMPLSMLFELWGESALESKILVEQWTGQRFEQVRTVDNTRNLRYTGAMFLYISQMLPEAEFFGVTGRWLRMSLSSGSAPSSPPQVASIRLNTVNAVQRRRAADQYFDTAAYDAGKRVKLLSTPVLDCSVWVDEAGSLPMSEVPELERSMAGRINVLREDGVITRCWIRWDRVETFAASGPDDRVYRLDLDSGEICFGNGIFGKVPPAGELNIRVSYAYGGGAKGNVPKGGVNALLGSIPKISEVVSITPMSGGSDRMDSAKVERLGGKLLRHRGKAVSAEDFEQIVSGRFEQAAHVKCFSGYDAAGARSAGHVCLVVMGQEMGDERMVSELCQEIYRYLEPRCDCNLYSSGRLHVIPSTEITVSASVTVELHDLDVAAYTQQAISDAVSALIEKTWRGREIGAQINISEIYQAVKSVPNVRAIRRIVPEGSYFSEGRRVLCALEDDGEFPFATVKNGVHTVKLV